MAFDYQELKGLLTYLLTYLRSCISANRHATEDRYKRAKNGLCKGD